MTIASCLWGSDGRLACKAIYGFRRLRSELDADSARHHPSLDCHCMVDAQIATWMKKRLGVSRKSHAEPNRTRSGLLSVGSAMPRIIVWPKIGRWLLRGAAGRLEQFLSVHLIGADSPLPLG
jgi:hypothetical protein